MRVNGFSNSMLILPMLGNECQKIVYTLFYASTFTSTLFNWRELRDVGKKTLCVLTVKNRSISDKSCHCC